MNRVLLVDDDQAMLFGYKLEMEMDGFKVDSAYTLQQAEQYIEANAYLAVVTDLNISGKFDLDGLKVIRAVQLRQPQSFNIVVTGVSDEDIRKRVFDTGVKFYLEKPVEAQAIIKLLNEQVAK